MCERARLRARVGACQSLWWRWLAKVALMARLALRGRPRSRAREATCRPSALRTWLLPISGPRRDVVLVGHELPAVVGENALVTHLVEPVVPEVLRARGARGATVRVRRTSTRADPSKCGRGAKRMRCEIEGSANTRLERGTAAASRRRPALPQARAREATAARRQRMRAHSKRLRRCFHCHCRLFHRSGGTEHTRTFFATVLALPPGGFISSPSVHVEYGWLMVALGPRTQCARSDERGNGEEGRRVGRAVWRREEWMGGGGGGGAGGGGGRERGGGARLSLAAAWSPRGGTNAIKTHARAVFITSFAFAFRPFERIRVRVRVQNRPCPISALFRSTTVHSIWYRFGFGLDARSQSRHRNSLPPIAK